MQNKTAQKHIPPEVARHLAVTAFDQWLEHELAKRRQGEHELRVFISERGKVQVKIRPPFRHLND